MSPLAFVPAAVVAAPPVATLHAGQRQWFLPGQLQAGARVACVGPGGTVTVTVPAVGQGDDIVVRKKGAQATIALRSNGAVEIDCSVRSTPPRRSTPPYVVGRNGLGLLRGVNTLVRVERLYGPGTKSAAPGSCRVAWAAAGLSATFTSCSADAVLTHARVTGIRWSSLNGVRIGDSPARAFWQDVTAKRLSRTRLLLGGGGSNRRPRLIAVIGAHGTVTAFAIETR